MADSNASDSSSGATKPAAKRFGGTQERCDICEKTVYPMEKIVADSKIYHKQCLKCEKCKKTLQLGNYAAIEGTFYCKPHFSELFKLRGDYSSGFGKEPHKQKWTDGTRGGAENKTVAEATAS